MAPGFRLPCRNDGHIFKLYDASIYAAINTSLYLVILELAGQILP